MDTWLCTETVRLEQGTLLRAVGEVDIATAPHLESALARSARMGDTLILDLAGLTFLSVEGTRLIRTTHEDLAGAGGRLVLWRPHYACRRTLHVTAHGHGLHVHRGPLANLR